MRAVVIGLSLACMALLPGASQALDTAPVVAPPLVTVAPGAVPVKLESATILVEPATGLARTTIDLVLRNPGTRVLEGNLQFPLAPGQQVVGFAIDIDGAMRDAVPVAKERARVVFDSIQRRGIDPALLESTQGDFFRLRIHPFTAGGSRHVRIVLVEPLKRDGQGWTTAVPLQFAAGLDTVDLAVGGGVDARVEGLLAGPRALDARAGTQHLALRRGDFNPARGVTLRVAEADMPAVQAQLHDGQRYVAASVAVGAGSVARALPRRIGLLWDSSMSGRTRAHDLEFALLDAYLRAAGTVDVQLVRLRDVAEPAVRYTVRDGDWQALRTALAATIYDGATNPGGWTPDATTAEYLLFSDGLFNYGAQAFPAFGNDQRLFAIQAGAGDSTRMAALANARHGVRIDLANTAALPAAKLALLEQSPRLLSMDAVGATDLVAESATASNGWLHVAARIVDAHARLRLRVARSGRIDTIEVPLANAPEGGLAALQWARFSLAVLQADPLRNQAAIESLGKRFGIVTTQTSLLVLENLADYVRYEITPPVSLRSEFNALQAQAGKVRTRDRQARIDGVAKAWSDRVAWWEQPFPKGPAPGWVDQKGQGNAPTAVMDGPTPMLSPAPAPPAPASSELDRVVVTAAATAATRESESRARRSSPSANTASAPDTADAYATSQATITLQPWQSDSPQAKRLRSTAPADVYALYLDERGEQAQGTAFYLDVADVLFERNQPMLALRVLSNLAEMDLDNRHVLRVLGYRLMQAKRADLAVPVLERVLGMGREEPQGFRDLALAYAGTQQWQLSADRLYDVVAGEWDNRFPDIQEIALAELNALIATHPGKVDTAAFDPRLLRNLPLALRAVLSWDSDNSDMDLWVTDPNGEKAYYGNRLTYQGGRMTHDFTGGYGPEEFALHVAKPGTYTVEANFYGERQQLVTGATTLQLWLSTGFGTPRQDDQRVTLRLAGAKESILVGEFKVK